MGKYRIIIVLLLFCTLFSLPLYGKEINEWTFLYYIAADNNLSYNAMDDINEMEEATLPEGVSCIALVDTVNNQYGNDNEEWSGCKIIKIQKDNEPNVVTSPVLKDMGSVNTGNPDLLKKFIKFGVDNFPAKRYSLTIWNHGTGWKTISYTDNGEESKSKLSDFSKFTNITEKSIAYDDGAMDSLTLEELSEAISYSSRNYLKKPFEIITFDACLMQMAEVAYEFRNSAKFIIGSEEITPEAGYNNTLVLNGIKKYIDSPTVEMAKHIATSFIKSYDYPSREFPAAVSVIDCSKINQFVEIFKSFISTLSRPLYYHAFNMAQKETKRFYDPDYEDLKIIIKLINDDVISNTMQKVSKRLISALDKLVILNLNNNSKFDGCGGISIYFPVDKFDPKYESVKFAQASGWLRLIKNTLTSNSGGRIKVDDYYIIDKNHDGIISKGESVKLLVKLLNYGNKSVDKEFILRAETKNIELVTNKINRITIKAGRTQKIAFRIKANGKIKNGTHVVLRLLARGKSGGVIIGKIRLVVREPHIKKSNIILVSEHDDSPLRFVEEGLKAENIKFDKWIVDKKGIINDQVLYNYKGGLLIRLIPECNDKYSFTPTEDRVLKNFLKHSGRIIISGQDFVYAHQGLKLLKMAGVSVDSDDEGSETIVDSNGRIFKLNGSESADNQLFMDTLNCGPRGKVIYTYKENGKCGGVLVEGNGYKIAILGFGIEAINGKENRGQFLRNLIDKMEVNVASVVKNISLDQNSKDRQLLKSRIVTDLGSGILESSISLLTEYKSSDEKTKENLNGIVKIIRDYVMMKELSTRDNSLDKIKELLKSIE